MVAEENSSATLIESFVVASDGKYFTNAIAEIVLKDGAQLEHYRLQRESNNAFHVVDDFGRAGSRQPLRHDVDQSRRATIATRYFSSDGSRRR